MRTVALWAEDDATSDVFLWYSAFVCCKWWHFACDIFGTALTRPTIFDCVYFLIVSEINQLNELTIHCRQADKHRVR